MRSTRAGVTAVFVVHGAVFGTWAGRIPAVRDGLGLSDGRLGIALLAAALGTFVALPFAGWTVARHGSRPAAARGIVVFAAVLPFAALAPNLALLCLVLFCFGAAAAVADVAMNAHGLAVEGRYPRPIFSSLHAGWSFGGLAGAAVAGLAARAGIGATPHFAVAAALLAGAGLVASIRLLPAEADRPDEPVAFRRPPLRLLPLAVLAFCVLFGEATAHDWSAVYVSGSLGGGEGLGAFAFAAFAATMSVFRLIGDRLGAWLGPPLLVRAGGLVAAAGLTLAVLAPAPEAAVAGFALVGCGLAGIIPILFRAAGSMPGLPAGHGIAGLTTVGYAAFAVAPPVIGFVADQVGLGSALWIVVGLLAAAAVLARATTPAPSSPRPTPPLP